VAYHAEAHPPKSMVDRLISFRAVPTLFIAALAIAATLAVIVANISAFWLLPIVLVGGTAILVFFGSTIAWRAFK
jgi:hypothetical protein